ncbi:transporter (NhaC family) [Sinobacterium caligoides]|uniref:Transporter (NhaC family) n=1 Tax=Sinobacterium caligoides TaxID=933926 RepID=A0A3N2E0D7_9GAMM|nr:Na+/H+ antiporter NhaC [Sinobacterium caligoides]ROS05560.1 transporter (NhaC family) [Sinobacterium caligoides]
MTKKLTLAEALLPVVAMLLLLGIGYGYYHFRSEPLLIIATIIAGLIALRAGVSWDSMHKGIVEKINDGMPATLILISVGMMIGTWMFSGTIPMVIYYGLQYINPNYILIIACLGSAMVSIMTGTSWGAVGTVGVAFIGIATGLGVSLPAAAGAIISGAFFGDKISPLSDTTNLAPIAAGSTLYEHIGHMLYTTVPALVLSLLVYYFVGTGDFVTSSTTIATPEKMRIMLQSLDTMYHWNIILILPLVIVLGGAVLKWPTLPVMLAASFVAFLLGCCIQGFSAQDGFNSMITGFNVSMVHREGFDSGAVIWDVTKLINRGGMMSMMATTLIAFCAFAFAGIMSKAGALEVILEALTRRVKSTGSLIATTVLSCITMAVVTGSSYLSIIVPGEMYRDVYRKRGLAAKNLSRTLEDSGTVIVPLVPWSMAGVYMASTLGVPVLDYLPWAVLCYTGFIFAIIYAYTDFKIEKIAPEPAVTASTDADDNTERSLA